MRLIDWFVSLAIRFQEWREPREVSPEELRSRRIEEQERARTQWLMDNRRPCGDVFQPGSVCARANGHAGKHATNEPPMARLEWGNA